MRRFAMSTKPLARRRKPRSPWPPPSLELPDDPAEIERDCPEQRTMFAKPMPLEQILERRRRERRENR
jgi:hypothetical protein